MVNKVLDWEATRKRAELLSISELKYTIQDCVEAARANKGWNPDAEGYYRDEASVYQRELMSREPEPEPEANRKLQLIKELMALEAAETPSKISDPEHVLPFVEKWRYETKEHFIVVTLDGAHQVINTRVVSMGIVNRTLVHPREIFRDAILDNASAIILVHNHPSGNIEPSTEDIQITRRLKEASTIIGIEILDHVIISSRGYYSFLEEGKI